MPVDWLYYLLLLFAGLIGVVLAIIGLPGIWLIVASAGLYSLLTGGSYLGVKALVALFALGVVAEVLETVMGGVAAGRAGGSRRGMIGAIVGGIIGAIAGTPLIPIPVVGTVAGACLGSFVGAFGVELLWLNRSTADSLKIGFGAAAGKLAGIVTKLIFGGLMFLLTALAALPVGGRNAAFVVPVIGLPATVPTVAPPGAGPPATPTTEPTIAPTTLPAPATQP